VDPDAPKLVAERALDYIRDGQVVGLGTGKAARAFILALGERVKAGLRVRGIPTSKASEELAIELGIPLTTLDETEVIDVAVDGADAVEKGTLHLLKGLGGALIREKVVAASARRFVVVVTEQEKICDGKLGTGPAKSILPVEVVPFALAFCRRRLARLPGCRPEPRNKDGALYITDNGNPILDCHMDPIDDPEALERQVLAIPGVVGTGLFLGMAEVVLVPVDGRVEALQRQGV
jgi:ribose 5-phosphate isomerase A